jgi:ABC-type Mn2+/Zn2+ transport system ATPase subunit
MKLTLTTKFKSLEPFVIDLPDFVVLTGINGAGKTQLLTAILNNQLKITDDNGLGINQNQIKYVTSQTLSPNESTIVTREQLNSNIQGLSTNYSAYLQNKNSNPNFRLENMFGDNSPQAKTIEKISYYAKKDIDELTSNDIYNHYPLDDGLAQTDVFYQNFSSLFKRYQDKFDDNEYREFKSAKSECDNEISFLSREVFFNTFGEAPWDFVNKIIAGAKLDYHINSPVDSHRDAPFELKLVNNINRTEIQFGDLSSGEKVLMSLALALYNSKFDIEFPKVLLMDEPDASLHPSMSKQFLNVIENVFVKEKKVKVIVTTHSPSTVALAPENTIFIVNKTGQRVEKVSKDKALKILTAGVPSFSVNYENRRQVFVESPNDVLFYEKIYQRLSSYLNPEISLSFISSGDSRNDKNGIPVANCGQVKNIVKILRDAGNNFVWGIIDWDLKNQSTDFVKVVGNGNRYNIESYLFDPILISALLLREKIILREDLDLSNNQTYSDFKYFSQVQLQKISDFSVNKISSQVKSDDKSIVKTKLLNEIEIEIPRWYLHLQGHELEEMFLAVFPKLEDIRKRKEELLKIAIIEKIIDDMPGLISVDLFDIYSKLQTI